MLILLPKELQDFRASKNAIILLAGTTFNPNPSITGSIKMERESAP
jgi:hypothetical protein